MVGASQNESVADKPEFSKILPASTKRLLRASQCYYLSLVTWLSNMGCPRILKGAICKNVAKNGYYTQIQNTAASSIRLLFHPLPSRLEVARAVGVSSVSLLFLPQ